MRKEILNFFKRMHEIYIKNNVIYYTWIIGNGRVNFSIVIDPPFFTLSLI